MLGRTRHSRVEFAEGMQLGTDANRSVGCGNQGANDEGRSLLTQYEMWSRMRTHH